MLKFKREEIEVSRIDLENRKYKIVLEEEEKDELFFTPILLSQKGKLIIISGFSFVEKRKGKIWANVLDKETASLLILKTALLSQREKELNIIEEANFFRVLFELSEEKETLIKFAEELLNKKYNEKIIEEIMLAGNLDEALKTAILKNQISFKTALEISSLEKKEFLIILDFFEKLALSFSNKKEFLTLIKEISKIYGIPIEAILKPLQPVLDEDINSKDKTENIRKILFEKRYPEISKAKQELAKTIKNMKLPPFVKLQKPNNLEDISFEASFKFKNEKDFWTKIEKIKHYES